MSPLSPFWFLPEVLYGELCEGGEVGNGVGSKAEWVWRDDSVEARDIGRGFRLPDEGADGKGQLERGTTVSEGSPPLSVPTWDRRVVAVGGWDRYGGPGAGEWQVWPFRWCCQEGRGVLDTQPKVWSL